MKRTFVLVCLIVALGFDQGAALHFITYGDTQNNPVEHQLLVNAYAVVDPELVLNMGDLWLGYQDTSAQFKAIITSNTNIAALLFANRYLVASGNHDEGSQILGFSPPIVQHDSLLYSFSLANSFFICMGLDPSQNLAWCEQQLQGTESRAAQWRFVFCHYPVYSSSQNYYTVLRDSTSADDGIPAFEALCDRYHVTMVFSGHAHNYERTFPIYGAKKLSAGQTLYADSGTVYVVTGGGGGSIAPDGSGIAFPVGANWWKAVFQPEHHYCDVNALDSTLILKAKKSDGTLLDSMVIMKSWTSTVTGRHTVQKDLQWNNAGRATRILLDGRRVGVSLRTTHWSIKKGL
jgi:acid phosphatase type 7